MHAAILTKMLPATNTKGVRVNATYLEHTTTVPWDYALNRAENFDRAAITLMTTLGKPYLLVPGAIPKTVTFTGAAYTIAGGLDQSVARVWGSDVKASEGGN